MQLKTIVAADPAAGAEATHTLTAPSKILAVRLSLVTSATAATRRVQLVCDDGTTVFLQHEAGATQAASLTRGYTFAADLGYEEVAFPTDDLMVGIPALLLPTNARVRTVTENLQAGDNYAAPVLFVAEFDKSDQITGEV